MNSRACDASDPVVYPVLNPAERFDAALPDAARDACRSSSPLQTQLAKLFPAADSDLGRLNLAFATPRFVFLRRQDTLAQAISWLRATQSGLWHQAPDGRERERQSAPKDPVYDPAAIRQQIARLRMWNRMWDAWFTQQGLDPLRMEYDALSADPVGQLNRVLQALGLDPNAAAGVQPATRKLSDGVNCDWQARFLREEGQP